MTFFLMPNHEVVRVKAGDDIGASLRELVDGLGGVAAFVKPGERVLLKPNFNTADPFPASSAPDFVAAAADLFHAAGADVLLGESSTFRLDTKQVMREWGMDALLATRPWLRVIDFNEGEWVRKDIPGGRALRHVSVPAVLDEIDRLVLLPCLKTHFLSRFTGALKVSVALMKPSERVALHLRALEQKIGEMNAVIHPDLVLMDARKCFITKGPSSGDVREPGLLLGSTGRVALDIEGIKVIQGFPGNTLEGHVPEEMAAIASALRVGVDAE